MSPKSEPHIELSYVDQVVYDAIRNYPSDIPVPFKLLAEELGCHRNTIYAATKRLEAAGLIRRYRQSRGQALYFGIIRRR